MPLTDSEEGSDNTLTPNITDNNDDHSNIFRSRSTTPELIARVGAEIGASCGRATGVIGAEIAGRLAGEIAGEQLGFALQDAIINRQVTLEDQINREGSPSNFNRYEHTDDKFQKYHEPY